MIVRCTNLNNVFNGVEYHFPSDLKIGDEFVVLDMSLYSGSPEKSWYRIMIVEGDYMTPALFKARYFEVISPKISSLWVAENGELYPVLTENAEPSPGGIDCSAIHFAPRSWNFIHFWEDYFENDCQKAYDLFFKEAAFMHAEEGIYLNRDNFL